MTQIEIKFAFFLFLGLVGLTGCCQPGPLGGPNPDGGTLGLPAGLLVVDEWGPAETMPARCAALGGHLPSREEISIGCQVYSTRTGFQWWCAVSDGVVDSIGNYSPEPAAPDLQVRVVCQVDQ